MARGLAGHASFLQHAPARWSFSSLEAGQRRGSAWSSALIPGESGVISLFAAWISSIIIIQVLSCAGNCHFCLLSYFLIDWISFQRKIYFVIFFFFLFKLLLYLDISAILWRRKNALLDFDFNELARSLTISGRCFVSTVTGRAPGGCLRAAILRTGAAVNIYLYI